MRSGEFKQHSLATLAFLESLGPPKRGSDVTPHCRKSLGCARSGTATMRGATKLLPSWHAGTCCGSICTRSVALPTHLLRQFGSQCYSTHSGSSFQSARMDLMRCAADHPRSLELTHPARVVRLQKRIISCNASRSPAEFDGAVTFASNRARLQPFSVNGNIWIYPRTHCNCNAHAITFEVDGQMASAVRAHCASATGWGGSTLRVEVPAHWWRRRCR